MTAMMLIQAKDFREFSDLPVARRDKTSQAMGKKDDARKLNIRPEKFAF